MSKNVTFHERERRFLVPHPGVIRGHTGNLIVQAYLFSRDGYVVRVRRTHYPNDGDSYHEGPSMVAVKGPRVAAARQEYEVEVPTPFATELIKRAEHKVSKTRYQIVDSGQTWDVDVFHGDNEGLMIAECECNDAASITIPYWCGVEVTDDPKYNNENLAADPYKTWSERP